MFALVLENVTVELAEELNSVLLSDASYFGAHQVNYRNSRHHAVYYRASLLQWARVLGQTCTLFYSSVMGDEKDDGEAEELRELGLQVQWEDLEDGGVVHLGALRQAALITLCRAISQRFPPGAERDPCPDTV